MILFPLLLLFCLQTSQYLLKISAASRLEGHRQHTIVLHKDSVHWEEPNRELKIEGRYFDVSKVAYNGNQLFITGHFDDLETAVFQLLEKAIHHSTQASTFNRMLLLLQCVVAIPVLTLLLSLIARVVTHQMQPMVCYQNPFPSLPKLPPRPFSSIKVSLIKC